MATNINVELFKRYAPKKKLEIINSLSESELLSISYTTILRIIKEAGKGDSGKARNKFKTLFLSDTGNNWNSNVTSIWNSERMKYISQFTSKETIQTPIRIIS